MRGLLVAALLGPLTAGAAPKGAQLIVPDESDDDKPAADASSPSKSPATELSFPLRLSPSHYQGVAPGADNLPPRPPALPVKGPARMTWPGFQVRNGVPTVFIELTGPVEWEVRQNAKEVIYTLKDVTIPLRNNRRPLDTREFKTAVLRVKARQKGRNVIVTIDVKGKVLPQERVEKAAGGFSLLMIELGWP